MTTQTVQTQPESITTTTHLPTRRSRIVAVVVGGVALAGVAVLAASVTGDDASASRPAVAAPARSQAVAPSADAAERWATAPIVVERLPLSADAAEHWFEADAQRHRQLCTSAPASADAIERCLSNLSDNGHEER